MDCYEEWNRFKYGHKTRLVVLEFDFLIADLFLKVFCLGEKCVECIDDEDDDDEGSWWYVHLLHIWQKSRRILDLLKSFCSYECYWTSINSIHLVCPILGRHFHLVLIVTRQDLLIRNGILISIYIFE